MASARVNFTTNLQQLAREVVVTFYRAGGPGGQKRNKTESAVRIYHPPSRLTVVATEYRSQARNRGLALSRLREKLLALNRGRKVRRPTQPSPAVSERRLQAKRIHAAKKRRRGAVARTDEPS